MAHTNRITSESRVDLIFHLKWKSSFAEHTDVYQASGGNMWRDFWPPVLLDALMNKRIGEQFQMPLKEVDGLAAFTVDNLFDVAANQFDRHFKGGSVIHPRLGRFYPKGLLKGLAGIFKANVQPFRCVGLNDGRLKVDFNHPLADKERQLSVVVGKVGAIDVERGGASIDWLEIITSGPGMQARWGQQPTDYFSDDPFRRTDDQPDEIFYRNPRFVNHIDDTAREMVKNTYGRFLTEGMRVLDLMSSWQSHMPHNVSLDRLVGLGLNESELKRNRRLSDFRVQDLNVDPTLPFDSQSFDAVVNTASVEYLIEPLKIFREVFRILRPGGYFIVTFSNRWFQTKTIRIWEQLHEFERLGLVLEYFLRSEDFKHLQTYSIRGLPRPHDDKYFPELPFSDPIYAVWGRKI